MSARYSKVREDLELRRKCVEEVGLGFALPAIPCQTGGPPPKIVEATEAAAVTFVASDDDLPASLFAQPGSS